MKKFLTCICLAIFLAASHQAWAVRGNISGAASREAYKRGYHAAMHNNYPEADRQFQRAYQLDPKNLDALNAWGVVLMKLGRYKESSQKFAIATRRDPKLAKAWYNWGVTLAAAGNKRGAAEKFRRTAILRPRFSLAYENWGMALIDLGQKREGIEKLRLAAKYDPKKAPQINEVIRSMEEKPFGRRR